MYKSLEIGSDDQEKGENIDDFESKNKRKTFNPK